MRYAYSEVELEKTGAIHDRAQRRSVVDTAGAAAPTDILVAVHGWNNNMDDARRLYRRLTDSLTAVEERQHAQPGLPAMVGVLWPSVRWADEDGLAGGGANVADPATALQREIADRVEDPAIADRLIELVPKLDSSPKARRAYLEELRVLLPESDAEEDDPPPPAFLDGDPQTVFELAAGDEGLPGEDGLLGEERPDGGAGLGAAPAGGGAAAGGGAVGGGAAGFGLDDFVRSGRQLLNLTTYYTMRDRAGKAGDVGIAALLADLAAASPGARLHLVGHSFGARAATAAAAATSAPVHSVTLLQGAFSHFGLAANWDGEGKNGVFRRVPARLRGPLVVTHTRNDRAVGVAYAVASRLARQVASGLGEHDDPYGGIGRNGALKTPEAAQGELLAVGGQYAFRQAKVFNLRSDRFVGGHNDVTGHEVAYALRTAMST